MNNEAENTMPAAEPVTGEENAAEIPAAETAPPTVKSGENGQPKPSWEELLQDPDYKSRYDQAVQGIVKARLRGRAQAEEKLARLAPVLSALEERDRRERCRSTCPEPAGEGGHLPPTWTGDRRTS